MSTKTRTQRGHVCTIRVYSQSPKYLAASLKEILHLQRHSPCQSPNAKKELHLLSGSKFEFHAQTCLGMNVGFLAVAIESQCSLVALIPEPGSAHAA